MDTPAGFSQEIPDEAFRIGTGARPLSRRRATIHSGKKTSRILWSNGEDLWSVFAPPKINILERQVSYFFRQLYP